jgi:hypothetical protein
MKLLLTAFILVGTSGFAQQTSVLFLGNSYTYTGNLPGTLYSLALAGGDTIVYDSNTPGGYTFEGHSTNATSLSKIASRNWDFVVLQEQSQIPSFPPSQVASICYPFAEVLVDSIRSNFECSEPIFFMTWGRRDGDQSNCANYPPLCTFEGMNGRLRESYLEMTVDNNTTVAPCGAAWHRMWETNATFWNGLYSGDGSHPSNWGTYLNACVFYATIFRKSPVGIPYYSSIGQTDAEALQQLAEEMVIDSLENWRIGHADAVAEASFSYNGTEFEFVGNGTNTDTHFWDFGDGTSSILQNPTHQFASEEVYEVMYISGSACDADTAYLSVDVGNILSVPIISEIEPVSVVASSDGVLIQNAGKHIYDINIIDLTGRIVANFSLNAGQSKLESGMTSGVYLIRYGNEGSAGYTKKVSIP